MKKSLSRFLLITALSAAVLTGCRTIEENEAGLTPFARGLKSPVCIRNAGDADLYVVGQEGVIYILDSAGRIKPGLFLDIKERVTYGGERGLLGLAFHPDFRHNGFFYVNYVGKGDTTHISRFSAMPSDRLRADPGSEVKLLSIPQPYENHNGGDLCFGPDGYLYIGLGDGGSAGDPGNRAQNPSELLGKMLRISVNETSWQVPPDNPFADSAGCAPEVWATGLRNPWRFSFDRLTHDLWIADVGQDKTEEIDFVPAGSKGGLNFGWRCYEGNDEYNPLNCNKDLAYTFPVYTYAHGPECSVTGGYVYRADSTSPWYGHYFFADYCSDKIMTLSREKNEWKVSDFGTFRGNNFCSFGEDYLGRLYVSGLSSGTVYRVNVQAEKKQTKTPGH